MLLVVEEIEVGNSPEEYVSSSVLRVNGGIRTGYLRRVHLQIKLQINLNYRYVCTYNKLYCWRCIPWEWDI